jgi:ADP-ribose pyrophosphatase YjhB (NUDIX family)
MPGPINVRGPIDIDAVPPDVLRLKLALPRLSDGRIDYRTAAEAPVVDCIVTCGGKVLLLKRSDKVGWMKNRWFVISGFLDDERPLREKALMELYEETRIPAGAVKCVSAAGRIVDADEHKRWIIYLVIIELSRQPRVALDWEHTEHAWVPFSDVKKYDLPKNVERIILSLAP